MKWLVLLPLLCSSALGQSTGNADPASNLGLAPTTTTVPSRTTGLQLQRIERAGF